MNTKILLELETHIINCIINNEFKTFKGVVLVLKVNDKIIVKGLNQSYNGLYKSKLFNYSIQEDYLVLKLKPKFLNLKGEDYGKLSLSERYCIRNNIAYPYNLKIIHNEYNDLIN